MTVKRYIGSVPIEYGELSSKTVSSDRITMALDNVKKRMICENEYDMNDIYEEET